MTLDVSYCAYDERPLREKCAVNSSRLCRCRRRGDSGACRRPLSQRASGRHASPATMASRRVRHRCGPRNAPRWDKFRGRATCWSNPGRGRLRARDPLASLRHGVALDLEKKPGCDFWVNAKVAAERTRRPAASRRNRILHARYGRRETPSTPASGTASQQQAADGARHFVRRRTDLGPELGHGLDSGVGDCALARRHLHRRSDPAYMRHSIGGGASHALRPSTSCNASVDPFDTGRRAQIDGPLAKCPSATKPSNLATGMPAGDIGREQQRALPYVFFSARNGTSCC